MIGWRRRRRPVRIGVPADWAHRKFGGARLPNGLARFAEPRTDCYCRSTEALETRRAVGLGCSAPKPTVNAPSCDLYRTRGKPGPLNVAIRPSRWVMATSGSRLVSLLMQDVMVEGALKVGGDFGFRDDLRTEHFFNLGSYAVSVA